MANNLYRRSTPARSTAASRAAATRRNNAMKQLVQLLALSAVAAKRRAPVRRNNAKRKSVARPRLTARWY